jgi:hypothetical protein
MIKAVAEPEDEGVIAFPSPPLTASLPVPPSIVSFGRRE